MKRVGFITPTDDFYQMSYSEVEAFCKVICFREENIDEFIEFSKNYSYFSPYFDFVMARKNYLFFNPLYNNRKFMIFDRGAYYLNDFVSIKYLDNVATYMERKSRVSFISNMTTVSDGELGITLQSIDSEIECMIDPYLRGMMSKTGIVNEDGSHIVTGVSVLNQLLINSSVIADDYYNYIKDSGNNEESDAVNYLVSSVGFLRVAGSTNCRIIIVNKNIISEKVASYLAECDKRGYDIFNTYGYKDSMVSEYQKVLGKKNS